MASTVQKMFLETDMDNLKKLQQLLHKVTDEKINQAIADVQNWLGQDVTTDVRQPYEKIKHVTESAIAFVTDICQQIEGGWETNVTEKLSAESGTRRSKETSKASAELSDSQIKRMEKKIASLESKYSTIESKYSLTESNYSQLANDVNNKFDAIDGTLTEMTNSMKSEVLKHTEKVEDIDKRVNSVEETQQTMTQTGQNLSPQGTALVGLDEVKTLNDRIKAMEDKMASRQDLTESKYSQLTDDVNTKLKAIKFTVTEMGTNLMCEVLKYTTKVEDIEKTFHNLQRTQPTMTETVEKLSPELATLGKKSDSLNVGFTAYVPLGCRPVKGKTVTGYERVRGNQAQSFCSDHGIFKAPVKGVYAVGIRQWQWDSGNIGMHVRKTSQSGTGTAAATAQGRTEERMCETATNGGGERDFCLEMTEMEVGDTLRVETDTVVENPYLIDDSSFSVFLISS